MTKLCPWRCNCNFLSILYWEAYTTCQTFLQLLCSKCARSWWLRCFIFRKLSGHLIELAMWLDRRGSSVRARANMDWSIQSLSHWDSSKPFIVDLFYLRGRYLLRCQVLLKCWWKARFEISCHHSAQVKIQFQVLIATSADHWCWIIYSVGILLLFSHIALEGRLLWILCRHSWSGCSFIVYPTIMTDMSFKWTCQFVNMHRNVSV